MKYCPLSSVCDIIRYYGGILSSACVCVGTESSEGVQSSLSAGGEWTGGFDHALSE